MRFELPPAELKRLQRDMANEVAMKIFKRSQEILVEMGIVDNGFLLASGKIIPLSDDEILIRYDAPYASFVEYGTRPHFPPVEPIAEWVSSRLTINDAKERRRVAFAIAHKIAKEGLEPRPYLRKAVDEVLA